MRIDMIETKIGQLASIASEIKAEALSTELSPLLEKNIHAVVRILMARQHLYGVIRSEADRKKLTETAIRLASQNKRMHARDYMDRLEQLYMQTIGIIPSSPLSGVYEAALLEAIERAELEVA